MNGKFFVHPSSIIDGNVAIGADTNIWHFCHVCEGAKIGRECNIGQNCFVGQNAVIGNNCKLQNNVSVYSGVELEDYVFCGPSMVFTNDLTPRCMFPKHGVYKKTLVKKGATLGANCTIVCNVTVGSFALIGAGAVVVKDVPDYAIVVGNPAKIIGYACKCGAKLPGFDGGECVICGRKYLKEQVNIYCAEDKA